jgi:hypothetical protein
MPVTWPLAVAIGVVSGTLSGMFGIGGALITTPAIRLLLGQPELIAVGTPLPVIVPSAVAGALAYARKGLVDVRTGLVVGAAGGLFAVVGARATTLVGGSAVMVITAAIICWTAVDTLHLAFRAKRPEDERAAHAERAGSWLWLAGLGAVAGLYSGFLGLGGGFIVVPALLRYFAFPPKRAVGTSLVVVSLLAIPGTVTHYFLGNIDVGLALQLAIGVVPGALIGARITSAVADRWVQVGFAVMLLVLGLTLGAVELGVF